MEDRQGIDADHGNMVKFSGATDPGYRKVKSTLEGDVLDIEVERAKAMEGNIYTFRALDRSATR